MKKSTLIKINPKLYLENIGISKNSFIKTQRNEIDIPLGWEAESGEEKEYDIARIYIGQHHPLNKNTIVLERLKSDLVKLTWCSEASDFNYYDERAKDNKLELSCEFKNV